MLDRIENSLVSKHREFFDKFSLNREYADLYKGVPKKEMQELFETAHHELNRLFRRMNEQLPTGEYVAHYWAEESRELLFIIETIIALQTNFKDTKYAFDIDEYYKSLFGECRDFLCRSGGSDIPKHHDKIELYYTVPLFTMMDEVKIKNPETEFHAELKLIGQGSYAQVFKYKDPFYNKYFVLKRALKSLDSKELARFRREYDTMNQLSSPYIVEVYNYRDSFNEYIMEYMDETLQKYISRNNDNLDWNKRKSLAKQVLKGFIYTQNKGFLHRDISHNNILIKEYDDGTSVVKISDFGLVKTPDSTLTSYDTEIKGAFNDPSLKREGFANYNLYHESYALTLIVYFIMTGKTNIEKVRNKSLVSFLDKGLNPVKENRFKNAEELLHSLVLLMEE